MKRALSIASVAVLVMSLPWGGMSATAGTPDGPEITDVAGDANGINSQGFLGQPGSPVPDLSEGPDARPASFDGADLLAIWFETSYETEKTFDLETGEIVRVTYVPTGLLVHIETAGPVKPTPGGYGMIYRVPAVLSGACALDFQMWLAGEGSDIERSDIRQSADCPSSGTVVDEGFGLSFQGNVTTLEYPSGAPGSRDLIFEGQEITRARHAQSRLAPGTCTCPLIDEASWELRPFVIGQDVPDDLECSEDPNHPDCQREGA